MMLGPLSAAGHRAARVMQQGSGMHDFQVSPFDLCQPLGHVIHALDV